MGMFSSLFQRPTGTCPFCSEPLVLRKRKITFKLNGTEYELTARTLRCDDCQYEEIVDGPARVTRGKTVKWEPHNSASRLGITQTGAPDPEKPDVISSSQEETEPELGRREEYDEDEPAKTDTSEAEAIPNDMHEPAVSEYQSVIQRTDALEKSETAKNAVGLSSENAGNSEVFKEASENVHPPDADTVLPASRDIRRESPVKQVPPIDTSNESETPVCEKALQPDRKTELHKTKSLDANAIMQTQPVGLPDEASADLVKEAPVAEPDKTELGIHPVKQDQAVSSAKNQKLKKIENFQNELSDENLTAGHLEVQTEKQWAKAEFQIQQHKNHAKAPENKTFLPKHAAETLPMEEDKDKKREWKEESQTPKTPMKTSVPAAKTSIVNQNPQTIQRTERGSAKPQPKPVLGGRSAFPVKPKPTIARSIPIPKPQPADAQRPQKKEDETPQGQKSRLQDAAGKPASGKFLPKSIQGKQNSASGGVEYKPMGQEYEDILEGLNPEPVNQLVSSKTKKTASEIEKEKPASKQEGNSSMKREPKKQQTLSLSSTENQDMEPEHKDVGQCVVFSEPDNKQGDQKRAELKSKTTLETQPLPKTPENQTVKSAKKEPQNTKVESDGEPQGNSAKEVSAGTVQDNPQKDPKKPEAPENTDESKKTTSNDADGEETAVETNESKRKTAESDSSHEEKIGNQMKSAVKKAVDAIPDEIAYQIPIVSQVRKQERKSASLAVQKKYLAEHVPNMKSIFNDLIYDTSQSTMFLKTEGSYGFDQPCMHYNYRTNNGNFFRCTVKYNIPPFCAS